MWIEWDWVGLKSNFFFFPIPSNPWVTELTEQGLTGWFRINNVIGWVGFNFFLYFWVGVGWISKLLDLGMGGSGLDFLPLADL
jgi:hypothetical protein